MYSIQYTVYSIQYTVYSIQFCGICSWQDPWLSGVPGQSQEELSQAREQIPRDRVAILASLTGQPGPAQPALLAVGLKTFVPIPDGATLFTRSVFWALFLPPSRHGLSPALRRGYLVQPVLWRQGKSVAYSSPWATVTSANTTTPSVNLAALLDLDLTCSSAQLCLLQLYKLSLGQSGRLGAGGLVALEDLTLLGGWLAVLDILGYASQPTRQTKQFAYLNMGGRVTRGSSPRLQGGAQSQGADYFALSFFTQTADVYFPKSTWQQVGLG